MAALSYERRNPMESQQHNDRTPSHALTRTPRSRQATPALDLCVTIIEEDEPWPAYLAVMRRLIFGTTTPPPPRPDDGQVTV
jgi:hypothetical protein